MTRTTPRSGARQLAGVGAIALSVVLGAGTAQAVDARTVTDRYLFEISLSRFAQVRADRPHAGVLDWSSDACSWSPDKPLGYDFTRACHRHDFGYRNYKRQSRFTETNRKRIDDNFYGDMKTICAGRWQCDSAAWTYYQAVRKFGAS
ncbi:phospholipase A2 [Amycolatopsis arida]|uniref:Phospholipase A2 n=1 Tax=Amycolatopsis arida TaxID=587909 RepID=A0A1I5VFS0_9PSEU|nr:phospholipase [Amycolatopsis arida]TDX91270.1 phospholipase A2-like protein [Amycolatopsis arida]SFQ06404.1 phospholipase A2 [Amycolatopsis arida]